MHNRDLKKSLARRLEADGVPPTRAQIKSDELDEDAGGGFAIDVYDRDLYECETALYMSELEYVEDLAETLATCSGDIPTKCPYCESSIQQLGKGQRYHCTNVECKAQCWLSKWYTHDEWETYVNCGCCVLIGAAVCEECRRHSPPDSPAFDKWESDFN